MKIGLDKITQSPNFSITKTNFSATSAILKKTALLFEVGERRKNTVPTEHNLPEIVTDFRV
jgi:hypothetical protein